MHYIILYYIIYYYYLYYYIINASRFQMHIIKYVAKIICNALYYLNILPSVLNNEKYN